MLQSGPLNMLQLNGTALPSLAFENLQELDELNLNGPDLDKAEETIAGPLASMYSGKCPLWCLDMAEILLKSRNRHRESTSSTFGPVGVLEP